MERLAYQATILHAAPTELGIFGGRFSIDMALLAELFPGPPPVKFARVVSFSLHIFEDIALIMIDLESLQKLDVLLPKCLALVMFDLIADVIGDRRYLRM